MGWLAPKSQDESHTCTQAEEPDDTGRTQAIAQWPQQAVSGCTTATLHLQAQVQLLVLARGPPRRRLPPLHGQGPLRRVHLPAMQEGPILAQLELRHRPNKGQHPDSHRAKAWFCGKPIHSV